MNDHHTGHEAHRPHPEPAHRHGASVGMHTPQPAGQGNHGSHAGHEAHAGHSGHDHTTMISEFRRKFWVSIILTIPVLALSRMIREWLGVEWEFSGDQYLLLVFSSVIYFYGGWPFVRGMFTELRDRAPGMMTLIGLAISVAYFYSAAVAFGLPGMDFFWELATLIDIMLLGHWIEMKSIMGASRALELLVKMMPAEAYLVKGGDLVKVSIDSLQKDDVILVKPGEKVAADGIVVEGESHVDESMLTGESRPNRKEPDSKVIGGSINGNGSLKVRVSHTSKDSYLHKVINLVQEAQKTRSRTQNLADRAARILTYAALSVGMITLVAWLALGFDFVFALERMVTVMVISCPHALGLAVPLVVAISTAVSAQHGLLIRNRTAFENSRKITTIVFDKTGTLTKGSHEVATIELFDDHLSEHELMRLASGVEQNSEHHISKGILRWAKDKGVVVPPVTTFNYLPGKGLSGTVENREIAIVGPKHLHEFGVESSYENDQSIETGVFVLIDRKLAGYVGLADQIREDAAETIRVLSERGIKNLLLTGDNEKVAKSVADKLKMDGFMANVLPHEKQERIKELQSRGEFVAMTGDGVNDAPALAQADVGIAVGSGTDVAAETADIILVNSNPKDIASLILFGRATYNKMIQNLLWATGYNIVTIPLAAGVLYKFGIVLSPAFGAVLMSLSTVIVAANAQLLRRSVRSLG